MQRTVILDVHSPQASLDQVVRSTPLPDLYLVQMIAGSRKGVVGYLLQRTVTHPDLRQSTIVLQTVPSIRCLIGMTSHPPIKTNNDPFRRYKCPKMTHHAFMKPGHCKPISPNVSIKDTSDSPRSIYQISRFETVRRLFQPAHFANNAVLSATVSHSVPFTPSTIAKITGEVNHCINSRRRINALCTGVPHERTDPDLVQNILSIIEPMASEQEQQQLHLDDDNTSWFGVLADSAGDLYFHDWGRYEEFLAQSRAGSKNFQFPRLVSFVGPTGAGKSTIVKALVKLFQKEHKLSSAQAPVVGLAEHQAVPTSGAVHLYWGHDTLFGEMPLLFADCEGLGGGSREPMSERAAWSKAKKCPHKKKKRPAHRELIAAVTVPTM